MFRLMNVKTLAIWVLLIVVTVASFSYSLVLSKDHFFPEEEEEVIVEIEDEDGNKVQVKQVSLDLYHWDNGGNTETDLVKKVCEEFMKKYPHIKVEVTQLPDYETQFPNKIAAASKNPKDFPDVFLVPDGNFGSWITKDVMLNLDEYWNNSKQIPESDRNAIAASALNRYRYNGKTMGSGSLYCVPKDISPYVMYYNKDLFDEYGVPYPSATEIMDPWTALEMWCNFGYNRGTVKFAGNGRLMPAENHIYGISKLYPEGLIWSNGADYLSEDRKQSLVNSPEFVEVYEYLVAAQLEFAVAPTPSVLSGVTEKNLFLNGQAACYIESRTATTDLREKATFNWDIAPIPAFETNQQCNGWSGSVGYAVSTYTEHPDEAYLLAEFFTSKEGQWIMAEAGFTTPLYNDQETIDRFIELEKGKMPANSAEFIRAAKYQRAGLWQYLPNIRWKTEFENACGDMFEELPADRNTPRQVLGTYPETMMEYIKQDCPWLFE